MDKVFEYLKNSNLKTNELGQVVIDDPEILKLIAGAKMDSSNGTANNGGCNDPGCNVDCSCNPGC